MKANDGPVVVRALNLADGLMADDPTGFKRGYSRENAELAVIDVLKLDGDDKASFLRIMEVKHGANAV